MSDHFLFRGAKVAYSIKGKGRSIILIHGFLGNKSLWNNYQKRLSKWFKVITIDLLGHGDSQCIGYLHDIELLAESIIELQRHLKIRKSILVGHSLGGYVSLAVAEKRPDSIIGLMLINSSAKGDSNQRKQSREQLISLIKKDKSKAIDLLVPSFFGIKKRNTHWQVKRYIKMAKSCDKRSIIATIKGMKTRKEREIILKFSPFPFQYLIGEKDPIFPMDRLVEEANLSSNGSHVILKNTSHMAPWEEEERVFKSIKEFSFLN